MPVDRLTAILGYLVFFTERYNMALSQGLFPYLAAEMSSGAVMTFTAAGVLLCAEYHFSIFHAWQIALDNMFDMHQGRRRNVGREV
jgi:hypothetical protein